MHRHSGTGDQAHIVTVHDEQGPIGSMPLSLKGNTAMFLGSHEVCDYQDLICAPGRQAEVLESVIAHLAQKGIHQLDLRTLRPESLTLAALTSISPQSVQDIPDEVTYEIALPDSWEAYLLCLDGKQRHEVRRKLRRLENHGQVTYRCLHTSDVRDPATETFLSLFRRNRADKAAFMSAAMESYFRDVIQSLSDRHMLRLCFLDVNDQPAAGVLCFDYRGVRYLYNSGYDERFEALSVGALSKALNIRNAIEAGCRRYDFLKGAEAYKKRLGGTEIPLHRYRIAI